MSTATSSPAASCSGEVSAPHSSKKQGITREERERMEGLVTRRAASASEAGPFQDASVLQQKESSSFFSEVGRVARHAVYSSVAAAACSPTAQKLLDAGKEGLAHVSGTVRSLAQNAFEGQLPSVKTLWNGVSAITPETKLALATVAAYTTLQAVVDKAFMKLGANFQGDAKTLTSKVVRSVWSNAIHAVSIAAPMAIHHAIEVYAPQVDLPISAEDARMLYLTGLGVCFAAKGVFHAVSKASTYLPSFSWGPFASATILPVKEKAE